MILTKEPSTPAQRQMIYRLAKYDPEIKEDLIYQITGDENRISTKDLSKQEAQALISQMTDNWGKFSKSKQSHRYIMSLLYQIGWTEKNNKHGRIPDLQRFSNWLKSKRSPINKPLLKMEPDEINKIIFALKQITKKLYK